MLFSFLMKLVKANWPSYSAILAADEFRLSLFLGVRTGMALYRRPFFELFIISRSYSAFDMLLKAIAALAALIDIRNFEKSAVSLPKCLCEVFSA